MGKSRFYSEKFMPIGLMFLISLVGLAACSPSIPMSSQSRFQNTASIRIGASISLAGDFAVDGKALQQGYQLWQDAVNKRGGLLGRPVQFDFVKDNSTPEQVSANYQKMISQNHDDLVVGPYSTLLTVASSGVVNRYHYAFVEGAGVAPKVFAPHYTNLFSVSLPATSYLKSFVYYILSLPQKLHPKSIAYASSDDFFTQPQIDAAKNLLELHGIPTAFYNIYPADTTTNYKPIADKIINSHADVVILGTNGQQDSVMFMNEFKQHHFNPKAIIATAGPDLGSAFIGPLGGTRYAEGIFVSNDGWFPDVQNYQNADFVSSYIAKFGGTANDISSDTVQGYSVGQVLEQAVTKIHSIDNASLINELHADTFSTLQGPVKFASDGQNTVAVPYLFQWQNGQLLVVYPSNAAQENPEYPRHPW
ncbi:MAG: amino acid ABC transporter substrate-binding protein [Ktedonobacteraceae bacterium]|nr:amino acid ABC transporter substrate-binding protein [Ktedonobacteraceae bacterium]